MGPDLSQGVNGIFSHRCTRATTALKSGDTDSVDLGSKIEDLGSENKESELENSDKCLYRKSFLVNEKGSVHLSFTREDVSTVRAVKVYLLKDFKPTSNLILPGL